MKKFLFVLLQCTWGSAQTLLGFLFFLSQYLRRSKDKQPDYVLIKCVP